jgi:hypothetical protein
MTTSIPKLALPLLSEFVSAFRRPTYQRFLVLMFAAILTPGRRTICNLLRTVGSERAPGDPSSYHAVFSQAHWSAIQLAAALTRFLLRHFWPEGVIRLLGDDTVTEHRGKRVYGKARHRDPIRSSHSYVAWRYGHKWVVLCILVQFPFASRSWALPVLVALYRSEQENHLRGRTHQTPVQLLESLLKLLLSWFPERRFILAADGSYGTHELARFAAKQENRLTLVSRFYADANLFEPPPLIVGKRPAHRPRVKGAELPKPEEVVRKSPRTRLNVAWYGGGRREVEVVTGTGHWYKSGLGLVLIRWVFVHDLSGTHRDEYFFSTDATMSAQEIIEEYTGRWSIEVTFQELRAYLGLESTRGWCRATVLRAAPCLFGLYSIVTLLYNLLPAEQQAQGKVSWVGKTETTFSDAITAVRRWLWTDWVFAQAGHQEAFAKLPEKLQEIIVYALAPAA